MERIISIFKGLCPNCSKDIDTIRLEKGLPCKECLPEESLNKHNLKEGDLKEIFKINEEVEKWIHHFVNHIKSKPWALQITWAKRVLTGNSFALLAPTGIGKTTFGISMATFLAKQNKKTYILLPTILLVEQIVNKLKEFGFSSEILSFTSTEKSKIKEKRERLEKGDFLILVTTSMFLYKNQELIKEPFKFIFIDDIDSFLKSGRNIDKVLLLLGFNYEDIQKTLRLIKLLSIKNKSEDDWKEINEIQNYIEEKKNKIEGVLVVSSATANPKSRRIKLFRELLNFEVGASTFYLRNIIDTFTDEYNEDELIKWIKNLGKGGLIFFSSDKGKKEINNFLRKLKENNINAVSYEEIQENINKFEKGEIDVLLGISSYKNPLARGFDMPHVVKYAIFYGVPKIVISLKFEKNLSHLLWAISSIRSTIVKKFPHYSTKINNWIIKLQKYQNLTDEFINERPLLKEKIDALRNEIGEFLTSEEIINLLNTSQDITLKFQNNSYFMTVADVTGYLQSSGRTSRLYAGGITKGFCLIFIDDKSVFNNLIKKIKWFSDDINFINVKEIDVKKIMTEIENERNIIKDFFLHKKTISTGELLKPVLIVVESPNKAKTIANFFGKPIRRKIEDHEVYETSIDDKYLMITASYGHILDLAKSIAFHGVIVKKNIIPVYEPIEGKDKIIKGLKKIAFENIQVLIATDPDTEGEKIGWDIYNILKPIVEDIKRMEFHEVTKRAIYNAIKNPRDFSEDLVKAQILRRIADRWIGFEFSQLLQKAFNNPNLSAGRVQTPVLGWIIEREKLYNQKIFKVLGVIEKDRKKLKFNFDFEEKNTAINFYKNLKYVTVNIIKEEEKIEAPFPPYRTDTMLKDASDYLKFSLTKTMEYAQNLFENGFITYHRTDSQRVSDAGISIAKEFIIGNFGKEYFSPRVWEKEGAHECIRPTKTIEPEELYSMVISGQIQNISKEEILLYELIFKRFIASQMKNVRTKFVTISIKAFDREEKIELRKEILEDGWNKVLKLDVFPIFEGVFNVENSKQLRIYPKMHLFTHGELVSEMKKKGIGRPSTYATIVEKLLEREYIVEIKGNLIPTELGKKVYKFLQKKEEIKEFLSENFTRELENLMDYVEEGKADYKKVIFDLYKEILKAQRRKYFNIL